MPDKDYIKKVYNFMDSAYGQNGAVAKGAFRGSFDNFYNRISGDEKYADKIFGALSTAYGVNGRVRKDAFTSDATTFRDKVLQPAQQPADITESVPTSDPVTNVLQSGKDLTMLETREPGLLQDIKAFEPAVKATEVLNEAQKEQGLQLAQKYLLDKEPAPTISMEQLTAKEAVDQQLNDPNVQYRNNLKNVLDKLDEEDKNRLATKATADALYQTPQGRFYYDFVRPVYKTALETGKNTAAFGARLVGADKTADKIVDYFDFDRLAREGNTSAALGSEPTKQQGKLGMNNIIPKAVEALTNMSMLMGGTSILGGGKAALLGSSFAIQYEDYRKTAKDAGLSDADADKFAITGAGLNSALELVSPNSIVLKEIPEQLTKKEIFNAIKEGVTPKDAIKKMLKEGGNEVLKENIQELSQSVGDNAVKYAFDKFVLNDPRFHQENILPTAQEALETMVLTTIATGITIAPSIRAKSKVPALERSAWAAAAENPQLIDQGVQNAMSRGEMTEEQGSQIKQGVEEYRQIYSALTDKGYSPDVAERMTMNAVRSKQLDQANKPLKGIDVLTPITAQDDADKANIERDVLDAAAGKPESDYEGITVQRPEDIKKPETITIGETPIAEQNINQDAIQEQEPSESMLRQEQPEVGAGNTQLEVPSAVGEIQDQEVTPDQQPSLTTTDIKARRDNAISRLKSAYDAYKTVGIVSDPERNLKRDKEFYTALTNYVKEEILYRANQVKGFASQKKAQIKRAVTSALKQEGIGGLDISLLNDAFEDAFAQTKKIPGVFPSETNDRISFKQYIKDRIRVRELAEKKGFKSGVKEGFVKGKEKGISVGVNQGNIEGAQVAKAKLGVVRAAIQDVLARSKVNLSMQQKRSIITMLQNATTSKDIGKSIDRAVEAATQMVWEAKNKQKITKTQNLIKSLNKLKRSKSMVAQDVDWIKSLNLPTPSKVDDLDTYQEMLSDFTQSRRGNEFNPKYTKDEISEFVDQENDRIFREKEAAQKQTLDDLKEQGILPEEVTYDEYLALLENEPSKVSEGISKKAELLKQGLKPKLEMLKDRLAEFDGDDKNLVKRVSEIDPAYLGSTDLIKLNNVLNNIAEFGTLDSAGDIVTSYEAQKMVEGLLTSKDKIRELPSVKVLSKKNLSNFMAALFYNDAALSRFRATTIGPIENKVSRVKNVSQSVVKDFVKLTKEAKMDGLSNNKLHVYAYLNQYKGNENGEIADDLKRRVDDLVDDAKYGFGEANRIKGPAGKPFKQEANNRLEALKELGLIEYSISDNNLTVNILDNFDGEFALSSLDEVSNKLTEGEKGVYNFARSHYDDLTDKLEDVTRNYAGKNFQRERNYISLVPRRKRESEMKQPELSADTDILAGLKSVNARPSNTTVQRTEKKSPDIYYDSDFFSNFINRYYTSLYTAEVLPDLQKVAKTVNSKEFEKYVNGLYDEGFAGKGTENYKKIKTKLADAINEEKYSPFFKRGKTSIADEVVNKGVRLVLGNVWQGGKQYIPALVHNFAINDKDAVAYALKSRGMALSPYNKEYAKARKELLKQFTGVQRSAVGSAAYDQYVKHIDSDMAWWQHPLEWLEEVRKLSSFVLEKADKAAQSDAYIAGYITSLLRNNKIKSISDFDIYEHAQNPNKEALAFAEQMASNINNESAKAYRPDVLKDPDKARNLWLLQGFALNAYQNAMNKAKIIFDNRATAAEKKEAAFHFLGYLGELSAYQLVGKWSRNFQAVLAAALLSALFNVDDKESEESKLARQKKANINMLANMGADLTMSGLDIPKQVAIKTIINQAYAVWAKQKAKGEKAKAKEQGEKFDPRGTYLSPYFKPFIGVEGPGGAAEFYTSLGDKAINVVKKGFDSDKKKSQEEKATEEIMDNLNKYLGIPAVVLGSGDLMIMNNRMQQILRQNEKSEKHTGTTKSTHHSTSRNRSRNTHKR